MAISDLKRKVQSLCAQVALLKEKKKPSKRKPTDRKTNDRKNSDHSGTNSKDFHHRNGKAAGKGFANNKNRESHPGSGRATSAVKGRSTKNSSAKSHGRKNASGRMKSD